MTSKHRHVFGGSLGALSSPAASAEFVLPSAVGGVLYAVPSTQPGTLFIETTPTALPSGRLASAILTSDTTITVIGAEAFPAGAGTASIGGDAIAYTGHSAGSQDLTGVTGIRAAGHGKGTGVQLLTPDNRVWHVFDSIAYSSTGLFAYSYSLLPGRMRFRASGNNYGAVAYEGVREVG